MSETDPIKSLKADVLGEVVPSFRGSLSPKLTADQIQDGVETLFRLLKHRVGDADLDAVGDEILAGLRRWFQDSELVKLADRYEPFCKFLLRVTEPARFAQLQAEAGDRLSAAKVLKELGLVSNKALSVFESCAWEQFPPAGVVGQPDFLEHVARTYVFRNVEDHRARELNRREKADIAESFCVFVVWAVIKFKREIEVALMTARFSCYLELVRNRFADIGARFVELTTESRSPEGCGFLDPLSPLPEAPSDGDTTDVSMLPESMLPEASHVTVIEAEPGAGKTMTLQFLAWQEAGKLLERKSKDCSLPVYVDLKLLCHRSQSIEDAVEQQLALPNQATPPIPWDSLLLLVDGLNEVPTQSQTNFKKELRDVIARFHKLLVVVAGRPNSFRGEFAARIVVLRTFSDEQLGQLFTCALADEAKAAELLAAILRSPFLSSWTRTPLHAAMVVAIAKREGITALSNHAATVRRFVRGLLNREVSQSPGQTLLMKKERLLSRLAFETKGAGQPAFLMNAALLILGSAKLKIGAPILDVPNFIQEVTNNHLLQEADHEAMQFAHELYSDYFAAVELEAQEQGKQGLGAEFTLAHFAELDWQECIRLFAGLASTSTVLIERGSDSNPWLGWLLLKDARLESPNLREKVADAAYCMLSGGLNNPTEAALAGACVYVLADLECAALLGEAITKQRQVLKPTSSGDLTPEEKKAAQQKHLMALVPLGYGLVSVFRRGLAEQRSKQEGRYCDASRVAIEALKEIKAAGILMAILASWTGKTFDSASLIPGAILDAILELGVDKVFDNEVEAHNKILVGWLRRASEAGFRKAWPAYGRVLWGANPICETETDEDRALYWLRKAHDEKDSNGSLELALFLIKKPALATAPSEGERLLRDLAKGHEGARYELGKLLMDGNGLAKDETGGFELLLSLAEAGYSRAKKHIMNEFLVPWVTENGNWQLRQLPPWAVAFRDRLKALRCKKTSGQR